MQTRAADTQRKLKISSLENQDDRKAEPKRKIRVYCLPGFASRLAC